MTKWEYYRAHILWDDNEVWQRSLDALGTEGWEMVGFEAAEVEGMRRCYFKRAIPSRDLITPRGPSEQEWNEAMLDALPKVQGKVKVEAKEQEPPSVRVVPLEFYYCEDDDSDRWTTTWQKLDEYMRDKD